MKNIPKKTAVIIDDHPLALVAIRSLLEANNISVLAEEEEGHMGLKSIIDLKPDIAIIDLDLPIYSGIEILESLRDNTQPVLPLLCRPRAILFMVDGVQTQVQTLLSVRKKDSITSLTLLMLPEMDIHTSPSLSINLLMRHHLKS